MDLNEISGYESGSTEIWYYKPGQSRDLGMGSEWMLKKMPKAMPDPNNLKKTHTLLGTLKETNLNKIYEMLQGMFWSPNGEARELINDLDLDHTSMSVGDIIKTPSRTVMVDGYGDHGFYDLTNKKGVESTLIQTIDRIAKKANKAEFERHLEQNPVVGQEFADSVMVYSEKDLDDPIWVSFAWYGHGHQSVHCIGISEYGPDSAIEAAFDTAEQETFADMIREAEEEYYQDFIEEGMSEEDAREKAYEWSQEPLDGMVYELTKGEFGEVAEKSKSMQGNDLSKLYDEDID